MGMAAVRVPVDGVRAGAVVVEVIFAVNLEC